MMRLSAHFSACRRYRYVLRRTWRDDQPSVMFVGLNPSTADERRDDPTVRRCLGFARRWGYGSLVLTNLFAYRATDPAELRKVVDPVGPDNDQWLRRCCQTVDMVVVAWGVHGSLRGRDAEVLAAIPDPYCLGTTRAGAPRHPLYLPADSPRCPFGR